jgi:hypothetical protein
LEVSRTVEDDGIQDFWTGQSLGYVNCSKLESRKGPVLLSYSDKKNKRRVQGFDLETV